MKKFIIPMIAVLAVAGALIASPILADDNTATNQGCCPVATNTPAGTVLPVCPMITGNNAGCCPQVGTAVPAATATAVAATVIPPATSCPVITDGICPGNSGCGPQGGCSVVGRDGSTTCPAVGQRACGNAGTSCATIDPNCPAVTGAPDTTGTTTGCGMRGGCGMWR